jgi:hypothetical protein
MTTNSERERRNVNENEKDEMARKYFDSGWNGHRREVLATAEHAGAEKAVEWSKDHPAVDYAAKTGE